MPADSPVLYYGDGGIFLINRGKRGGAQPAPGMPTRGIYWSMKAVDAQATAQAPIVRKQEWRVGATNNDAEWMALRECLMHAAEHHADRHIIVHSDSQIIVKQFLGEYRATITRHNRWMHECHHIASGILKLQVVWVPRRVSVRELGH